MQSFEIVSGKLRWDETIGRAFSCLGVLFFFLMVLNMCSSYSWREHLTFCGGDYVLFWVSFPCSCVFFMNFPCQLYFFSVFDTLLPLCFPLSTHFPIVLFRSPFTLFCLVLSLKESFLLLGSYIFNARNSYCFEVDGFVLINVGALTRVLPGIRVISSLK